MLPQLTGVPIQSTESSNDAARNINQLLPVGKNVSATVVAVSRDQIQPEVFKLKLEINNRLIQLGVFQALPVGQKINVNRQSDGQIQVNIQPNNQTNTAKAPTNTPAQPTPSDSSRSQSPQQLQIPASSSNKLPAENRITAAVISSRPVYPQATQHQSSVSGPQIPQSHTQNAPASNAAVQSSPSQAQAPTPSASAAVSPPAPPVTSGQTQSSTPAASGNMTTQPTNPSQQNQVMAGATNTPTSVQPSSPSKAATTPSAQQASQPPSQTSVAAQPRTSTRESAPIQPSQPNTTVPQSPNIEARNTSTSNAVIEQNNPQRLATQTTTSEPRQSLQPSHHQITVALPNGTKAELISSTPLQQGTQLLLQRSANDSLQVLQQRPPALNPASALDRPGVQEVLRNSLPTQLPTGEAFSQLAQVANSSNAGAAQIGSVVRSMLQLFGVKPGSPEAPAQIRQNVELGGLSTERTISRGLAPNATDMKAQLQQLQKLADNLPMEQRERFEQLLSGIHSRVTSQQVSSLQQWREMPDGGFERVFQLDLPIKQGDKWDNLELRLSREGGTNAAGEMVSVWRVRLHFDLEEKGGVDAEVRLTDGHEISTLFWCEHKDTADTLRERSEEFAARLRECGFNSSEINWHEGTAPEQKQVIQKKLIDLHT